MPVVAGELADEEKVTLGPQESGGGGVGLRDGAGEGLVVHVDDQLPALYVVLKLPDECSLGEELAIEGGIQ